MEPTKVLIKHNDKLLRLPVDQPNFIVLLQRKSIIHVETVQKIDIPKQTIAERSKLITDEINRSLPTSPENLEKFICALKEYKLGGMETLARQMETDLNIQTGTYVYTYICI